MVFFGFWAFNTAGKTVTKVGIYALPPLGRSQKVVKIDKNGKLSKFMVLIDHDSWLRQIIRDPI
jgi:hypothetical protein